MTSSNTGEEQSQRRFVYWGKEERSPPPSAKIMRNCPPPFRSWKREIFYENACFSCPKSSNNAYFSKNRALRAHIIEKLQFLGPFRPSKRPIFDPFGCLGKISSRPPIFPKVIPPFRNFTKRLWAEQEQIRLLIANLLLSWSCQLLVIHAHSWQTSGKLCHEMASHRVRWPHNLSDGLPDLSQNSLNFAGFFTILDEIKQFLYQHSKFFTKKLILD